MAALFDLVATTVSSAPGTGSTISLGPAATINGVTFLSFAGAGTPTSTTVAYSILDTGASEIGTATFLSSGVLTSRTPTKSTNGNAAIVASSAAIILCGPRAEDIISTDLANSFTAAQQSQAQANIGVLHPPQGRLTLTSGVPVLSSTVSGATTVYYTPYIGNVVPIYNGTTFFPTATGEISQATTDATKSPAAVAASSVYDIFVWNDSGTIRATRGPAWTNSTTRGYTLTNQNGILVNTSAITNGPGASLGTWVGTIASNGASTIDMIFGGTASGGTAGRLMVWNTYNRRCLQATSFDSSATYTYTSAAIREANGSTGNQVSFVLGAQEDETDIAAMFGFRILGVVSASVCGGIGLDSTVTFTLQGPAFSTNGSVLMQTIMGFAGKLSVPIGVHTISKNEVSDGSNANFFNQSGNTPAGYKDYISVSNWL